MPVGPLVLRALEFEALDQGIVGCRADQRDRPRVRDVCEQCTERDRHRRPETIGDAGDLFGEQPPPECGFGAEHEDDVGAGERRRPHADGRPQDRSVVVGVEAHLGSDGGEIGERLGIDLGEHVGIPRLDHRGHRGRRGVAGIVPTGETGDQDGPIECRLGQPSNMLGSHDRHAIGAYRGADAAR